MKRRPVPRHVDHNNDDHCGDRDRAEAKHAVIGPGRSWHVVHLIVLVLAAMGTAYIVFNVFDGFRELRQRRRHND